MSKETAHQRQSVRLQSPEFDPGKLAKQLRRDQQRAHPEPEFVSIQTLKHIDRARKFKLPDDVVEKSLTSRAFETYLNVRATMTSTRVQEMGARFPGAATEKVVCEQHNISDLDSAPVQDVIDVYRGICIAKIALQETMLAESPSLKG